MADLTTIQLLHTADPTKTPSTNEKYGELKADENGALWIRSIADSEGVISVRTARTPDEDDIDPNDTNGDGSNIDITAFDGISFQHGFNSTDGTWNRLRSGGDNSDLQPEEQKGILKTLSRLMGFNGSSWDRISSLGNNVDGVASYLGGLLGTLSHGMIWTGGDWIRNYKTADFSIVENIPVAETDTVLKTFDITRKYLLIQNTHDTDKIFINFNGAASNFSLVIEAGQNYEPLIVPVSAINAIAENESTNVVVVTA